MPVQLEEKDNGRILDVRVTGKLVENGINSISLNPDTVLKMMLAIGEKE
jgi:phosphoenolpyruvate synthase/pyruvate phosphate dikinase